ncbi:hypothetical protein HPP92_002265 [Vanilla planifolia]|uniref:Uncharacterized protein n=1 Tax=Vanilla planifolia TaxID=51239 RepID=A0A835VMC5_VANPL|nr:hypothetical protein HPP92_002265 [Vanilla planifolia]
MSTSNHVHMESSLIGKATFNLPLASLSLFFLSHSTSFYLFASQCLETRLVISEWRSNGKNRFRNMCDDDSCLWEKPWWSPREREREREERGERQPDAGVRMIGLGFRSLEGCFRLQNVDR